MQVCPSLASLRGHKLVKFRIIPSILTDGISQVKGSQFVNWRTVGSVLQAVKVHAARDVDEILLLDVMASRQNRLISPALVSSVSRSLRVPLAVGGGVRSVEHVSALLDAGADKIVLGSGPFEVQGLVAELAQVFGSQAVVCSVDIVDDRGEAIALGSGTVEVSVDPLATAVRLEAEGAGEILVQNLKRDGSMSGPDLARIAQFAAALKVPLIAGSGIASGSHVLQVQQAGASAASIGALFQFSHETPASLKAFLAATGVPVRS